MLIVSDYAYPTGGVEQATTEVAAALGTATSCKFLSWSEHVLHPPTVPLITIDNGDIRAAWAALDECDVILMPVSFNVRLLSRFVSEYVSATGKPLVSVLHTSGHSDPSAASAPAQEAWLAEILRKSALAIAVAPELAASVEHLTGPTTRLMTIENGARLRREVARARHERCTVGFMGRPVEQKGFPDFVRLSQAFAGSDLRFLANTVSVPVKPDDYPTIEVSSLSSDQELEQFLDSVDVLVAPYRRADGLPLALLEAINCGVPVIGYDAPGVGSLLRRHEQHVVDIGYDGLRAAVEGWARGELQLRPPTPGRVPGWTSVGRQYVQAVTEIAVMRQ